MKELRNIEFLYQKDWVEKRGIFLVFAFFLGGLGAGLYLVSLYLHFFPGLLTGYLIVLVGKGSTHMIFLGKPWRFWRGFAKPQTSWISRGLIAILLFLMPATLQIATEFAVFSWLPWNTYNIGLQIFVVIGALALIIYTGFALAVVKAIRAWNSGMIPLLFIIYSFMGGFGLTLGMVSTLHTDIEIALLEKIALGLMITAALLWVTYLWTTSYCGTPGVISVKALVKGRAALPFYFGIVFLGLIIPLAVTVISLASGNIPSELIAIAAGCEIIGGFSMRYSILKIGVYAPLFQTQQIS
jgi:formate-dependent nitrite reductase membrane component NrfD